jgi:3-dehydroquinate synthase
MVDSSVGGKTGINLPQGKNLVGAFHQPVLVLADPDTLRTLPRREYVSGLAEVVKYGVIRDAGFFAQLEKQRAPLAASDPGALEPVIARCCEIKADVVRLDEREGGLRAILNFGHTLGHALEQATGYGRYLHGEAVAMGMAFAARLSAAVKGFPPADCARVTDLLGALGLPVRVPGLNWADVRRAMQVDKKTVSRGLRFVLVETLGRAVPGCEAPESALRDAWESCAA